MRFFIRTVAAIYTVLQISVRGEISIPSKQDVGHLYRSTRQFHGLATQREPCQKTWPVSDNFWLRSLVIPRGFQTKIDLPQYNGNHNPR